MSQIDLNGNQEMDDRELRQIEKECDEREKLKQQRKNGIDIDSVFNSLKAGDIVTTKIDDNAPLRVLDKTATKIKLQYQSGDTLELERDESIFAELKKENPDDWDCLKYGFPNP